jgi:hypothetical protein
VPYPPTSNSLLRIEAIGGFIDITQPKGCVKIRSNNSMRIIILPAIINGLMDFESFDISSVTFIITLLTRGSIKRLIEEFEHFLNKKNTKIKYYYG